MKAIQILSISIVIITATLIFLVGIAPFDQHPGPIYKSISDKVYSDSIQPLQEELLKERQIIYQRDSVQLVQKKQAIRNLGRETILESIEKSSAGSASSSERLVAGEVQRYLTDSIQLAKEKLLLAAEQVANEKQQQEEEKRMAEQRIEDRNFIVKLAFSIVFCFAGLFVVLSNRYDEGTKKWAFSVLTLIAGVWIGSSIS